MSKKVTVTKQYLTTLKDERDRLKKEIQTVREDRNKFRDFYVSLLKENVAMVSKNQYYSAESMILKLSKLMNNVESWWWG